MSRRPDRTSLALALPVLLFVAFGATRVAAPVSALGLVFDQPLSFALVAALLALAGAVLLFVRPVELRVAKLIAGPSRELTADERRRAGPMFERLHARTGVNPERLIERVLEAPDINAGAGAGHLLFMTTGALALDDERLEAVLAHEYGHHRGLHPALTAVVWWLSLPGLALSAVYALLRRATSGLGARFGPLGRLIGIPLLLVLVVWQVAVMWIYLLGELLTARAARVSEFEADAAAARWGYAQPLEEALEAAGDGGEPDNLLARLRADHPPLEERIERLRGHSALIEAGGRR